MFLNQHRLSRQSFHFLICQTETIAFSFRHIFNFHLLAMLLRVGIDHADFFRSHITAHNRRATRGQRWLMHVKFIRVNCTLHHHFTQSQGSRHKDYLVKTGFSINGEHHSGCGQIGTHHTLDTGRKCHATVIVALMHTVRNGTVIKQ